MKRLIVWGLMLLFAASFFITPCYAADVKVSALPDGTVASTWHVVCQAAAGPTTSKCTVSSLLALKIGTVTEAKVCLGDASGVIQCTTNAYQTVITNPVTGPASPAANNVVKYTGTGQGTDNTGVIFGTMTDGKGCSYATSGTALSCTQTIFNPAAPGAIGGTTPAAGAFTTITASTSLAVTAAATTGGYIRLLEGTNNGTDYSVITGAADAGTYPSFTFGGSQGSEDLTLTATNNLWTFASTTGATIAITPALAVTGTLTAATDIVLTSTTAGVRLTGGNGLLTIKGEGDGTDEDLTINLNSSNAATISSSTGVTSVSFSALNVVTTGTLSGLMPTVIYSADGALGVTAAQARANTFFLNTYAGTLVMTLPAAEAGMAVCLRNGQNNSRILQVHSDGTDYLVLPATGVRNTAANHFAATASPMNQICLVAFDTTDWYITSTVGTWAAE